MGIFAGYVKEGNFRAIGTSGGLCRWLQAELIKQHHVAGFLSVVRCAEPPLFRYAKIRTTDEIVALPHSVYVPVERTALLKTPVRESQELGMVGLPCDVEGTGRRFKVRLGLICGGTRPAGFLDPLVKTAGIEWVDYVDFREKRAGPRGMKEASVVIRGGGKEARWSFAQLWAEDPLYVKGCYNCPLTFAEKADISFGDAWLEPYRGDWMGWNLVVVRKQLLADILHGAYRAGRIELRELTPQQYATYRNHCGVGRNR